MRIAVGAVLVVLLCMAGAGTFVIRNRLPVGGPIYSLGQVEASLQRHPEEWVGKPIRLRAFVFSVPPACLQSGATPCGTTDLLVDDSTLLPVSPTLSASVTADGHSVRPGEQVASMPMLLRVEPNPFLDRLRSIPILGRLLPGPQSLHGGTVLVTIEPAGPGFLCPEKPCFQATMSDAGPEEPRDGTQGLVPIQQGMIGFDARPILTRPSR